MSLLPLGDRLRAEGTQIGRDLVSQHFLETEAKQVRRIAALSQT